MNEGEDPKDEGKTNCDKLTEQKDDKGKNPKDQIKREERQKDDHVAESDDSSVHILISVNEGEDPKDEGKTNCDKLTEQKDDKEKNPKDEEKTNCDKLTEQKDDKEKNPKDEEKTKGQGKASQNGRDEGLNQTTVMKRDESPYRTDVNRMHKDFLCYLCHTRFFLKEGLKTHYNNAHNHGYNPGRNSR